MPVGIIHHISVPVKKNQVLSNIFTKEFFPYTVYPKISESLSRVISSPSRNPYIHSIRGAGSTMRMRLPSPSGKSKEGLVWKEATGMETI